MMGEHGEARLDALRRGLSLPPEQIDTGTIAPIFVPVSFVSASNWPGPFVRLHAPEIVLTWSILFSEQTMRYVDHRTAQYWEGKGTDWKGIALANLKAHSNENPGTHQFQRANGEYYAIAMMHEDGIGPSRLLLRDRLSRMFPRGYRVALPEMSCGLAFGSDVEEYEEKKLLEMIGRCHDKGTRPLAPGIYDPEDLLPVTG